MINVTKSAPGGQMCGIVSRGKLGEPGHFVADYIVRKTNGEYSAEVLDDAMEPNSGRRFQLDTETAILAAYGLEQEPRLPQP